jgi:hypothetical protein
MGFEAPIPANIAEADNTRQQSVTPVDSGRIPAARGPGFTLQFLSANTGRLRDFRFNPLRAAASMPHPPLCVMSNGKMENMEECPLITQIARIREECWND